MKGTAAAKNTLIDKSPADAMVHVVGQKSLNTELLVDFMAEELEFTCRFSPDECLTAALTQFPDRIHLTFIDCSYGKDLSFLKLPHLRAAHQHPRCHFILYNTDMTHGLEMDALRLGIRGILYAHQPIEFFARAARAVLNGELWYSRNILAQFILEKDNDSVPTAEACVVLTQREKEIVAKLAEGCSNRTIARHFCISPNTVKTHAYNIYKKIKVDNRLQASLWLANSS